MGPTRWQSLVSAAGITAVVVFAALRVWQSQGGGPLPTPAMALLAMVAIAAFVLAFAWPVRRWTAGDRDRPLDPLRAARAVVAAKAASLGGALLAGWYAGQALSVLGDLGVGPRRERLVMALLALGLAALVVGAGQLAERWCRLPDDPDDGRGPGGLDEAAPGSHA